jgi:putative hydrolase of HD superfamily
MTPDRADSILGFLALSDRLRHVHRRSRTIHPDGTARPENSAEHSWHMALLAMLMQADFPEPVDLGRALSLIIAHDLVEIEAGDTDAYDEVGRATQAEREALAAQRLFATLPADLATLLGGLWEEFETGQTAEARFAMACDRAQGFFQQVASGALAWREVGLTRARSLTRMQQAIDAAPGFAVLIGRMYETAESEGHLLP